MGVMSNFEAPDLKTITNPVINHYQPEFLGQGGHNLVYAVSKHPTVVKIDGDQTLLFTKFNLEGYPLSPEEKLALLANYHDRYSKLVTAFGREHFPNQRKIITNIPMSKELLQDLGERFPNNQLTPAELEDFSGETTSSLLTIQSLVPELALPTTISLTASRPKTPETLTQDKYVVALRNLTTLGELFDNKGVTNSPILDFRAVYPSLWPLLQTAYGSEAEAFEPVLTDFLGKAINYTVTTGEVLDIASPGNVIFYKNREGDWTYLLPDALTHQPPLSGSATRDFEETYNNAHTKTGVVDLTRFRSTFNSITGINALAGIFGFGDLIKLPSSTDFTYEDVFELLKKSYL